MFQERTLIKDKENEAKVIVFMLRAERFADSGRFQCAVLKSDER